MANNIAQNKRVGRFSKRYGIPNETGQDQMNALIQMNDLHQLIKDFESPESALGGLSRLGGQVGAGTDTAEKLFSILQGQEMNYPRWRPGMTAEEQEPHMDETPYDITDIISNIAEGKQYKDKATPGWNQPQIGGGGIGGGMQGDPEKMKGIMGFLQRLLPGGKTGYR